MGCNKNANHFILPRSRLLLLFLFLILLLPSSCRYPYHIHRPHRPHRSHRSHRPHRLLIAVRIFFLFVELYILSVTLNLSGQTLNKFQ